MLRAMQHIAPRALHIVLKNIQYVLDNAWGLEYFISVVRNKVMNMRTPLTYEAAVAVLVLFALAWAVKRSPKITRTAGGSWQTRPQPHLAEWLFGWLGVVSGIVLLLVALVADKILFVKFGWLAWLAPLLQELGGILIGTCTFKFLYETQLGPLHLCDTLIAVKEALREDLRGYSDNHEAGLRRFHKNLPTQKVCEDIAASDQVKINKTFLPDQKFDESIGAVLRRSNGAIRICFAEPRSKQLRARSRSLHHKANYGEQMVLDDVSRMRSFARSDCRFEVDICNGWLTPPLIVCDKVIYKGDYLRWKHSFEGPWLEIDRYSQWGKCLEQQFDTYTKRDVVRLRKPEEFSSWLRKNETSRKRKEQVRFPVSLPANGQPIDADRRRSDRAAEVEVIRDFVDIEK
ncbi:MAG: hypothetical protein ABSC33_16800 [Candidatus Sulfotelmatobacter sp.]